MQVEDDHHILWRYFLLIVKMGGLIAINFIVMVLTGYFIGGFFDARGLFIIIFVLIAIGVSFWIIYQIVAHTDFTDISRTTEIEIGHHDVNG